MCDNDFSTTRTKKKPGYSCDSRGSQTRPPEQAGPRGAGERAGLPTSPSVLCDALVAGNPREDVPASEIVSQGHTPGGPPKDQCSPGWLPGGTQVIQGTTDGVPVIHRLTRKPVPSSVQSVPAAGTGLALLLGSDVSLGPLTGVGLGSTDDLSELCTLCVSPTSLSRSFLPASLLLFHPFPEISDCFLIISSRGASY